MLKGLRTADEIDKLIDEYGFLKGDPVETKRIDNRETYALADTSGARNVVQHMRQKHAAKRNERGARRKLRVTEAKPREDGRTSLTELVGDAMLELGKLRLSHSQRDTVQSMVLQRIEELADDLMRDTKSRQSRLDSIGVFDRDINRVRVHSSVLVELRKRVDIEELAREAAAEVTGEKDRRYGKGLEERLNNMFGTGGSRRADPSSSINSRRKSFVSHPRGSAMDLSKSLQYDISQAMDDLRGSLRSGADMDRQSERKKSIERPSILFAARAGGGGGSGIPGSGQAQNRRAEAQSQKERSPQRGGVGSSGAGMYLSGDEEKGRGDMGNGGHSSVRGRHGDVSASSVRDPDARKRDELRQKDSARPSFPKGSIVQTKLTPAGPDRSIFRSSGPKASPRMVQPTRRHGRTVEPTEDSYGVEPSASALQHLSHLEDSEPIDASGRLLDEKKFLKEIFERERAKQEALVQRQTPLLAEAGKKILEPISAVSLGLVVAKDGKKEGKKPDSPSGRKTESSGSARARSAGGDGRGGHGGGISALASSMSSEELLPVAQHGDGALDVAIDDDLYKRLEQLWEKLQTPVLTKLDLVIKYTSRQWAQDLPNAIQLWENACSSILKREKAMEGRARYEAIVFSSMSDDNTSARESAEMKRLVAEVENATEECAKNIGLVYEKLGDHVTYKGENYADQLDDAQ